MTGNRTLHSAEKYLLKFLCLVSILIFLLTVLFFLFTAGKAISPAITESNASAEINSLYLLKTTLFTFTQSLCSLALSLLIGIPSAFFIAKRSFPLKKFFSSFAAVPLCVPPLIIALGYISTFGVSGIFNRMLMTIFHLKEAPFTFLYSFWGIVLCQGFYNFPVIMVTVAKTWNSIDENPAAAARLLGASDFKIFRTITFYQLLPGIISACIPVFIYCFFSFMIVQLFGGMDGTTLEVSIYHAAKSSLNFRLTAILALIETVCAFIILFLYNFFETKAAEEKQVVLNEGRENKKISTGERIFFILLCAVIFIFFLMPVLCILINSFSKKSSSSLSFTLINWQRLFRYKGFLPALKNTIITGFSTGISCTICGTVFSYFMFRKNNFFLKTISILPMAVSSIVLGFGIITFSRSSSPLFLVLCQCALNWPFAFRQIYASMKKIPEDTLNAARLYSFDSTDFIFRIVLPYSKKGILSAFGFCFALSAGDASLPLMLSVPHFDTLALFTYRLAGSYRINEACASGILLGALCMTVFALSLSHKERN